MRLAVSFEKRVSTHRWCSGENASPLIWRYEKSGDPVCTTVGGTRDPAHPSTKVNPLRAYANVPFGAGTNPVFVSVQQRFQVMVTIFFGEPGPPQYTAWPDQWTPHQD